MMGSLKGADLSSLWWQRPVWELDTRRDYVSFLCSLQTLRFLIWGDLSAPCLSRSVGFSAGNIYSFVICIIFINLTFLPRGMKSPFLSAFLGKKIKFRVSIDPLLSWLSALSFEAAWGVVQNVSSATAPARQAWSSPVRPPPPSPKGLFVVPMPFLVA